MRRRSRGVLGDVHRRAQDSREIAELLPRTDPVGVGADESELLDAVAQHEPCRDLGDARRLAHARGPDDREHAAVIGHVPVHERQTLAETAHDDPHRLLISRRRRHVGSKLRRQRRIDAQLRELPQQARADGRLPIQIAPGQARELRLEQPPQVLDLERHGRVRQRIGGGHRRWRRHRCRRRRGRCSRRPQARARDLLVFVELRRARSSSSSVSGLAPPSKLLS